ncbi:hypothetical protein [Streptococcus jiangjianxini]|uniref:hypothetical protein n=1 Tax=Streptococcus jiangjianxini TaxID=3161189 RepID=UPI0032EF4A09
MKPGQSSYDIDMDYSLDCRKTDQKVLSNVAILFLIYLCPYLVSVDVKKLTCGFAQVSFLLTYLG